MENNDRFSFKENAILLVTDKTQKTQIIKIRSEGGGGNPIDADDKFSFDDVNFDGIPDLLVKAGSFGAQGALRYYCFIQKKDKFKEVPTYTDIMNPIIDRENKCIKSEWRNSACSYGSSEYKYKRGKFKETVKQR